MIARLACAVIIVGTTVTGCGVFDRAEQVEPPSTSIVDTPNGDLEIITIPGFDNPPPTNEFETPELSGDPVTDYLNYSGPTNIPFIQIDNGQLISLAAYTHSATINTSYTYAVSDPTDKSLDDRFNEIVGSITQKYPGLTPEFGSEETHSETRDYFDSRSTRLSGPKQANIEDIYVAVTADSRYPDTKFIYFVLAVDGTLPDPLPIGRAVDTMIGPLRDAAGLTNNDITDFRVFIGWELTATDVSGVGGVGMAYQPLTTQITMNAGAASPEQVQATLQPLLDSDWKQDRVDVSVSPNPSDPDTTDIFYRIRRPGEL